VINSIRACLAEFGIVAPVGRNGVAKLLHAVAYQRVPEVARACLAALGGLPSPTMAPASLIACSLNRKPGLVPASLRRSQNSLMLKW
jgi:hypothetical protein